MWREREIVIERDRVHPENVQDRRCFPSTDCSHVSSTASAQQEHRNDERGDNERADALFHDVPFAFRRSYAAEQPDRSALEKKVLLEKASNKHVMFPPTELGSCSLFGTAR
jgi:hypothetical protein